MPDAVAARAWNLLNLEVVLVAHELTQPRIAIVTRVEGGMVRDEVPSDV